MTGARRIPGAAWHDARMPGARELRDALRGGQTSIGLWATIPSPLTAEAAAAAGADYVVVDQQHGAVAPGDLAAMLIADPRRRRGPARARRAARTRSRSAARSTSARRA